MRQQKAPRLQHRGDDAEAQGSDDEIADHVGTIATPTTQSTQTIRAELTGSDHCSALGIVSRSALALCRALIEAGRNPNRALHAYRGDVLALAVRSIGEGARLRIASHGVGFERLPECTGSPPVRANERDGQ